MRIPRVDSGRPRPRRSAGALLGLLVMLVLAGCGTTIAPSAIPAGSIAAATVGPPVTTSSPPSSPSPPAASGPAVAADPALLAFVPTAGLSLTYDAETTAQVAADPTLATSASALAIALALPSTAASPVPSGPAADLAVVSVIRLRDPSADEVWFRGWRDSYDEAACANAGGVIRRAETDIRGHRVFVGSCSGGSFTYHVRIGEGAVVISLTSIGPARIGEAIMEGLAL